MHLVCVTPSKRIMFSLVSNREQLEFYMDSKINKYTVKQRHWTIVKGVGSKLKENIDFFNTSTIVSIFMGLNREIYGIEIIWNFRCVNDIVIESVEYLFRYFVVVQKLFLFNIYVYEYFYLRVVHGPRLSFVGRLCRGWFWKKIKKKKQQQTITKKKRQKLKIVS